jgi:hypothetical protein
MQQDDKRSYHATGRTDHEKLQWLRGLLDNNVSLASAYYQIHRHHLADHAAASTAEAVVYELRTHGLAQLRKPNCQRRLGALAPDQLREVIARLIRLRPQYPKLDDELLLQLEERLP